MSKDNKPRLEISIVDLRNKIDRIIGLHRCLFLLTEDTRDELMAYISPPHQDLYLQIEDELENLDEMLKQLKGI